ncbi:MAG TPA: AzlD domain-containing protein [Casimicrobiaceae bacterium]|nr:AzlD domain-containing protein [Casimicrobiaceae bacterium]
MDGALKLWSVVAIVGVLNYLSRVSFIAIFARRHVPVLLARAFRYVPAAMLTALVLPMVVAAPGAPVLASAPKIVAAAVAGAVAFVTHSTLKTLATGMLTLWALQLAGSAFG